MKIIKIHFRRKTIPGATISDVLLDSATNGLPTSGSSGQARLIISFNKSVHFVLVKNKLFSFETSQIITSSIATYQIQSFLFHFLFIFHEILFFFRCGTILAGVLKMTFLSKRNAKILKTTSFSSGKLRANNH